MDFMILILTFIIAEACWSLEEQWIGDTDEVRMSELQAII